MELGAKVWAKLNRKHEMFLNEQEIKDILAKVDLTVNMKCF